MHNDCKELAMKIAVWIQDDIDEGECDPSEWIEDLMNI